MNYEASKLTRTDEGEQKKSQIESKSLYFFAVSATIRANNLFAPLLN